MPPRSSVDREESSIRDCSWASCESSKSNKLSEPRPLTERTVRFAATAKVRQVVKLTRDQAKDVWFNNEDLQVMKKSFAPTVVLMANGSLDGVDDNEEHCKRGLEYRTKDGARRRMKNKYDGMSAVLHEQDRQVFENAPDPEVLAKVYQDVNCKCSFEALALGRRDEEDIKEYMSTDNEPVYDDSLQDTSASSNSSSSPRFANRRLQKLKHSGSFHERSIRGIKRILSGSKLRRKSQTQAVTQTVLVA